MRSQTKVLLLSSLVALVVFTGCHKVQPKPQDACEKAAAGPAAPSKEELAGLLRPGLKHKVLEPLAGKWNANVKFWNSPKSKPQESKATSDVKWVLGKRFLHEDFSGKIEKHPFEGMGLVGYDNLKKQYVSIWADSMGTGVLTNEGEVSESGKVITFTGEYIDPMSGNVRKTRSVLRIAGDNKHVYQMYETGPDGVEFQSLEVLYTRKGGKLGLKAISRTKS